MMDRYLSIVGQKNYEIMLQEARKSDMSFVEAMKEQYQMWLSVYSGR